MQFERWITIDMAKGQTHAYDIGTLLCSGDENSVRVGVEIVRNKAAENVTGAIKGYVTLPNGLGLMPFDGASDMNKAWIDLPQDALGMTGRINIAVRSFDTEQTTVLLLASANVCRVDADQYYDPSDYVGDITELISDAQTAATAAQAALDQASNIVSYAAQTPTNAQARNARNNIDAEEITVTPVLNSELTAGKYVRAGNDDTTVTMENGAPAYTSSTNAYVWVHECAAGDRFTIHGVSAGTYAKLCLFIDASGNILAKYGTASTPTIDMAVTAPAGSAFVVFHRWGSGASTGNSIAIGAAAKYRLDELDTAVAGCVHVTAQTLTDAQQTIARHNINAPSEPGVVGGDQHLAITATMENAWLSGGAVVYNANFLMSQIFDVKGYMLCVLDTGYSAGALYYASGVTNRASYSSTSGFKTGWLVLKPGDRVSVVLRRNSDNTPIPLSDLKHMRIYDGYGKPSYSYTSPIASLTSFAKIVTPGTFYLQWGTDIVSGNLADLPSDYPSSAGAVLQVSEYLAGGNQFLIQRLSTVSQSPKEWFRYTLSNGTAYNPWQHVANIKDLNASVLAGKKISIYGDSISTFSGYIPSGNVTWYTGSNCGVAAVTDTWWKKTIDALGLTLLVNNSWSGRFACGYADTWTGRTTNAGYKQANIDVLGSSGTPDIIVIMLGINDFNNEAPMGDYDGTTTLPTDPNTFTGGYAMMLDRIMTTYPLAQIYCCTCVNGDHNPPYTFPEINGNGVALSTWNDAIRKLAGAFGAKVIDFSQCGITHYNMETYVGDYDQQTGDGVHPNAAGHSLMANQAIHDMDESVKTRY